MELGVHHHHLHLQFLHPVTPPLTINRRRQVPHHVRGAAVPAMPIRDLTLRRIRFHHPKLFCNKSVVALKNAMADEAKSKITADSATNHKKEEAEKKPEKPRESIPPPPEKPLPDDCCGSGCVRCVWDIYYDELEEYNKLYKTSPDS